MGTSKHMKDIIFDAIKEASDWGSMLTIEERKTLTYEQAQILYTKRIYDKCVAEIRKNNINNILDL